MTGRDGRCARTAIGQIAAVPPINVMNSRRRMYGPHGICSIRQQEEAMSALGQKQIFAVQNVMSALPPKADICGATADVCFVPIADIERLIRSPRRQEQ